MATGAQLMISDARRDEMQKRAERNAAICTAYMEPGASYRSLAKRFNLSRAMIKIILWRGGKTSGERAAEGKTVRERMAEVRAARPQPCRHCGQAIRYHAEDAVYLHENRPKWVGDNGYWCHPNERYSAFPRTEPGK